MLESKANMSLNPNDFLYNGMSLLRFFSQMLHLGKGSGYAYHQSVLRRLCHTLLLGTTTIIASKLSRRAEKSRLNSEKEDLVIIFKCDRLWDKGRFRVYFQN